MLNIQTKQDEITVTLKLDGIIDLTTYSVLLARLKAEMDNGVRSFVFDMDEVFLFDSTGIGELYYFVSEHKVSINFVNVPSFIQETLEMMGFFDALKQIETEVETN
ncbi:anti-sigma factor antagonist [Brevibacillus nitrificans]|uniref:Anti-sigma factor antagonist n=1 Tax=Brevibacillus nitrificans TaxID=651560 RepID=A0A3M8D675_9BACL|nr:MULTISPECIES: STAS domain-containing protein [Brevibacillus]MED1950121.1 STAS domain-containing protein [Brevibacillus centrosporus]RNB83239.1 anti-sigma factor antagonist [Brevibacillus nitrificans]